RSRANRELRPGATGYSIAAVPGPSAAGARAGTRTVMTKKIKLVLADVDGTLLTEQKILTERAQGAVKLLKEAGISFAITSGRPPRGMAMLIDPLKLETPIAGFNGGMFVDRNLAIVAKNTLPPEIAREAVDLLRSHDLDTWVYCGNDWLVSRKDAPHV